MITREAFCQIATQAREALQAYHLHDALHLVDLLSKEVNDEELLRQCQSVGRDYTAMLDFIIAYGSNDPQRNDMQCRMVRQTLDLLNRIETAHRLRFEDDHLAICHKREDELQEEKPLEWYFYHAVTTSTGNEAALLAMETEIREASLPQQNMLLSGLFLSLWNYLDPGRMQLLLSFATTHARAMVALVLIIYRYETEMTMYPEVEARIHELFTKESITDTLARINHDLFIACQSEKIEDRIKNELMPTLFKGVQDEELRLGFTMDEDDEEDEFAKMLRKQQQPKESAALNRRKKEFHDSAMELINLHREGVDIGSDMFAHSLRLPFFHEIANWFKPFSVDDKDVHETLYAGGKPNPLFKMMLRQDNMCDLDRYALILNMAKQFPHNLIISVREIAEEAKKAVMEAEAVVGGDYERTSLTYQEEISNSVKLMYRLLNKSRWKQQLHNVFGSSLNLLNNSYLKPILVSNAEILLNQAKLMSKYGSPDTALDYLHQLSQMEGMDADTLMLMAECQQKTGKHRQALNSLSQADMLKPDNTWILTQMHNCYVQLQQYEQQLECLLRLETLLPDSTKITTQTGLCLMKLGRYHEASQRFFKLELEDKQLLPSLRSIAWCAFKQKKYEQAMRYYKKLFKLTDMPDWSDYLNAGHTAWMMDDMMSAMTFYHQYIKAYLNQDPKRTDALGPFDRDKDELMLHGKSARDIDLMHDMITYRG